MDLRDQLQSALGTVYAIEHELGGGGMSRVFVASEKAYGRKVVIKVLPPELAEGVSIERFRREIQLAAQLQHPHIVPLHTSGEVDGLPYYTMPFVDGTSLRARLASGLPVPIGEATTILREVAKALAYAHERGVVHRDIKPDNVLVTGGSAVVTDFGIAKALSASRTHAPGSTLTQLGTSIGTPAYMAPEQAAGDPATDHRADLYAFACMGYEVLTGEPPFTGRPPQKLLAAHMAEVPRPVAELRPDTPSLLAELITRCLAKDPDDRPQSAADLVKVLDSVVTNSGGGHPVLPAILLSGRPRLVRALALYIAVFAAVALLTRAADLVIGLPDWVFPSAIVLMALGLPAILFTALVHHGAHRAATMANVTPGGTPVRHSTMARLAVQASPWVTWRRTALGGAAAMGGLVLLTAAYLALRTLGIGPMGSLMASGTFGESERLLVADFASPANDSTLGQVVTEAFRSDLSQSRNLRVMQTTSVAQVLRRMERRVGQRVDFALAREIATREGIKAVLDGEVLAIGGSYVIAAKLHAAQSGEVLATFRVTADDERELIPAIGKLARDVRGKVGESLRTVNAAPPLEQVTTPSLDALKKYVQAVRIVNDSYDTDRAVALLEEAIALDTGFAMAYRKIGIELMNRGGATERAKAAIEKAYTHRARLSDVERHLTEAAYHTYGPAPDNRKALAAYEALLEIDPRNPTALNNASAQYARQGEFAKSEVMAARAVALDSSTRVYQFNLLGALIGQRKTAELARTIEVFRRRNPASIDVPYAEAQLALLRGDYDAAERTFRDTYRTHKDDPFVRRDGPGFIAELARLRGRLREAEGLARTTNQMRLAEGMAAAPLYTALDDAFTRVHFFDDDDGARRILDAALQKTPLASIPPRERPYDGFAEVYAVMGDAARTRAMLAGFEEMSRTVRDRDDARVLAALRGHVAFAEGRYPDALQFYRAADVTGCRTCILVWIGRAHDLGGNADSAIVAYTAFTQQAFTWYMFAESWNLAGVHKRLGELLEARGDRAAAATHYLKFIELWERADPSLQPRVAEVRQRLARLRAAELH